MGQVSAVEKNNESMEYFSDDLMVKYKQNLLVLYHLLIIHGRKHYSDMHKIKC